MVERGVDGLEALLRRVLDGDQSAAGPLLAASWATVHKVAARWLSGVWFRPPDAIDELRQLFWERCWAGDWTTLRRWDHAKGMTLSSWLHRIARFAFRDWYERFARGGRPPPDEYRRRVLEAAILDPHAETDYRWVLIVIERQLDDEQRQLLEDHLNKVPAEVTAARMGISTAAVNMRIHRLKQRIAEMVQELLADDAEDNNE